MITTWAPDSRGVSPGRQSRSWKADSATVVTSARTRVAISAKKTSSTLRFSGS